MTTNSPSNPTTDYAAAVVMPVAHEDRCRDNLPRWVERGYRVYVTQDKYRFPLPPGVTNIDFGRAEYVGWPKAVNGLVCSVLAIVRGGGDFGKLAIVAAGDDMRPDPNLTAEEMSRRYYGRFPDGFGVMQPTGDDWSDSQGRIAERICGSPIFGEAWARRAFGGSGPLPECYFNFYADEELKNVAGKLGVLWMDPGTSHYHDHHSRKGQPPPVTWAVTNARWDEDKRLFESRRASGFPGHEPLP